MTYCRNTDLISSDEDTFDEIWSESDHLIWHQLDEPALAEVVDERGVHELVLKQNRGWLKNRRIIFPTWATVCTINILCCRKCERTWGFKERIWEMLEKKQNFTFGMSMSMLWSAQYLKMSESIVTPVLENKISIDTDPFVRNTQSDLQTDLPTPALQWTNTGVFLFFPAATWSFIMFVINFASSLTE